MSEQAKEIKNYHKPGPVITRPMTQEEKEYFRKRKEMLDKQNLRPKKNTNFDFPGTLERDGRG